MELSKRDVNLIIETLRRAGKASTEISEIVMTAWPDTNISLRRIQEIAKSFRDGDRDALAPKQKIGRPRDPIRDQHVDLICTEMQQNSDHTTQDLAEMFNISKTMVHRILTEDLQFKSLSDKWVPHILTEVHKANRIERSETLMEAYNQRNSTKHIVVTDEKWFYSRPLGNHKSRRSWVSADGDRKHRGRRTISDRKFLAMVAVNFSGLTHFKVLEQGQTVNSEVYTAFLEEVFIAFNSYELQQERRSVSWENAQLQHDNARPHVSLHTCEFLRQKNCRLLKQPPYSPDLNILDRMVFPKLEMARCHLSLDTRDQVEEYLEAQLATLTPAIMRHELTMLRVHCQNIIDNDGNYVNI